MPRARAAWFAPIKELHLPGATRSSLPPLPVQPRGVNVNGLIMTNDSSLVGFSPFFFFLPLLLLLPFSPFLESASTLEIHTTDTGGCTHTHGMGGEGTGGRPRTRNRACSKEGKNKKKQKITRGVQENEKGSERGGKQRGGSAL